MRTMVVRQPGGIDRLELVQASDPGAPGPGSIRVRLQASSLNFHDLAVAMGFIPASDGRILLSDGAGLVEAVGEDVSEFSVGDAVVSCFFTNWVAGDPPGMDFSATPGDGLDGYAREAVITPAAWFTRAPKGWSALEAATLTTAGLTAWRALVVDGGLKAGDIVLALGTGGVSIFALQLAKAMGARVAITSSSDEKLERARALGADFTVNYRHTPDWAAAVVDWTGGRGADHVIEVGGPGTLAQSIQACRIGGHIALIGVLTGRSGEVPTALMMAKQIRLQGLIVGSRRQQMDMVRAVEATGIRPVVDKTFLLEDLAAAFAYEAAGQHFGKIGVVIEP